jgi:hypothetical protein
MKLMGLPSGRSLWWHMRQKWKDGKIEEWKGGIETSAIASKAR